MATPVTMPKLGLTMNSGTISRWNRQEGEPIGKGELLMTVATDKLTFEVESPAEGTVLKIVVSEGRDVPVGEILAYIGQPGDSIESVAVDGADPRTKKIDAGARGQETCCLCRENIRSFRTEGDPSRKEDGTGVGN
ncbi:lipoyl domain-containing protein [Aminivibrio sp.]|uniref:lipoyl domain-containing protein n=1 Tax=Aminivibrio sp. TaxID=1872489 RepID=UPI003D98EF1E